MAKSNAAEKIQEPLPLAPTMEETSASFVRLSRAHSTVEDLAKAGAPAMTLLPASSVVYADEGELAYVQETVADLAAVGALDGEYEDAEA